MKVITVFLFCIVFCKDAAAAPKELARTRDIDIEEIAGLFEGDMILPTTIDNGLIDDSYRWPNATVIYELDANFTLNEIAQINRGWAEISATTCIKFASREPQHQNYVYIQRGTNGTGCFSAVGMQGGRQVLNYEAPSCTDRHGTVIHEMLHTLGFYHEQSRPDRDDYITVVWDKIEPGKEHNFNLHPATEVTAFGAPYDYGSVLHYSARGFSIDGNDTLVPKIPGVTIGQRLQISQLDAGKVRLMYNCPAEW